MCIYIYIYVCVCVCVCVCVAPALSSAKVVTLYHANYRHRGALTPAGIV